MLGDRTRDPKVVDSRPKVEAIEEVVREQSKNAKDFYERLWRFQEKSKYVNGYLLEMPPIIPLGRGLKKRGLDKHILKGLKHLERKPTREKQEEIDEIKDIKAMILQIYKKYKKDFLAWLKSNEDKLQDFMKLKREITRSRISASEYDEFLKKEELFAEQILALFTKWLMIKVVFKKEIEVVGAKIKTKNVAQIIKDLQKLYELGQRLAWKTGKIPLFLATLEAEYLRCIGELERATTIEVILRGFKKIIKVSTPRFEKIARVEQIKGDAVIPIKVMRYNKSKRCFAVKDFIEKPTTMGDIKEDFEYVFRQDLMGYLDEQGKRIVKIELMNMNREDRITPY